jgi:hypothetical protein
MNVAAGAFKRLLGQEDDPPEAAEDTTELSGEEPAEAARDGEGLGNLPPDEPTTEEDAAPSPLPASWPAEQAAMWRALPAEAQAFIAAREAQRDSAVHSKFEEAAHLRKAHEAEIEAANLNRTRYAEAVDQLLGLVVPQPPPRSMLDRNSDDYDPDAYHYRRALHEDMVALVTRHAAQRQQIAAQEQSERFEAIDGASRDAFLRSVPEAADQAKAPAVFRELIDYAVGLGTPAHVFATPTTALEWHVLWKAREYDRLQEAKARVEATPPPAPKPPQPALRPGVPAARGAVEQQKRASAMERLAREGSVDAGAAALKHLLKGKLA